MLIHGSACLEAITQAATDGWFPCQSHAQGKSQIKTGLPSGFNEPWQEIFPAVLFAFRKYWLVLFKPPNDIPLQTAVLPAFSSFPKHFCQGMHGHIFHPFPRWMLWTRGVGYRRGVQASSSFCLHGLGKAAKVHAWGRKGMVREEEGWRERKVVCSEKESSSAALYILLQPMFLLFYVLGRKEKAHLGMFCLSVPLKLLSSPEKCFRRYLCLVLSSPEEGYHLIHRQNCTVDFHGREFLLLCFPNSQVPHRG